jgi:hypothetical protein
LILRLALQHHHLPLAYHTSIVLNPNDIRFESDVVLSPVSPHLSDLYHASNDSPRQVLVLATLPSLASACLVEQASWVVAPDPVSCSSTASVVVVEALKEMKIRH